MERRYGVIIIKLIALFDLFLFFFFNNLKCEIIIINFVDLSYLSTKQDSRRKRVKGIEGFHFFPFFSIFKIYNEMINFVVRSFILEK